MIDREILDILEVYIRIQNIQLLKYIAQCEGWDFKTLCKNYL
jgi:hypothetical protein